MRNSSGTPRFEKRKHLLFYFIFKFPGKIYYHLGVLV